MLENFEQTAFNHSVACRFFSQKQQFHTCLSALTGMFFCQQPRTTLATSSMTVHFSGDHEQVSGFSSGWQYFVLEHLICDVLVDQIPFNFIL